jgi:ERCC4-related helicase
MVETSLFYNTLVCLPTGLGKTFIATNVILNYYRWFPKGKIYFLAPTRPLVSQQIEAVSSVVNINKKDMVELTGQLPAESRVEQYVRKRIFFMTPQTLENDLKDKIFDARNTVCVIFGTWFLRILFDLYFAFVLISFR